MNNISYEATRRELAGLISTANRRLQYYAGRNNKFSAIRLLVFIAEMIVTIYLFTVSVSIGWIALVISLFVFGIIVHFHNKLLEGIRRLSYYTKIQEENLARIEIDWEKLPGYHSEESEGLDFIERDLDLYGNRSLHCIIDNTVSAEGSALLRKKLHGDFPGISVLKESQTLVKELSALRRMRNRFLLRARLSSRKKLVCAKTVSAFDNDYSYTTPAFVIALSFTLVSLLFLFVILLAFGIYEGPIITILLANLLLYFAFAGKVGKSLEKVNDIEPHISKLDSMISVLAKSHLPKESQLMNKFPEFFSQESELHSSFTKLRKISTAASYRENSILRVLLNIAFPYDFIVQRSFERTAINISSKISTWLSELNELECLIALANFGDLNPEYTYAAIDENGKNTLEAGGISHPLMKVNERRSNNFSFNSENEIVIITGSNMSGKSTFLRTVGINLCLAYAGAPSACTYIKVSPFTLFTCIRVSDSVFDGISYFYAEVKRLRMLLDILESHEGPKVLFFIDEIFKGTNNRERLKGSMSFLKKIASMNCTGFVTTHDLELVGLSDSVKSVKNYHFRENISEGVMTFEYKIHPGPCPTTNALEIMKLNRLPVDD
jgi:ABC-type multidrug transport system fused ATPase/permease subunit